MVNPDDEATHYPPPARARMAAAALAMTYMSTPQAPRKCLSPITL
jgi:hypothetical protein